MKNTKKEKIYSALYVIRCKSCREILASASEKSFLPQFSTCDSCCHD